ncbi:MAG: hypothetical protein M0C28_16075 [Candidatus Moduliflexus flocculans]|nr:hypothetical protein [Candidatus Moduliflexus flocculans]
MFEAPQKLRKLLKGLTEKQLSQPAGAGEVVDQGDRRAPGRRRGRPRLALPLHRGARQARDRGLRPGPLRRDARRRERDDGRAPRRLRDGAHGERRAPHAPPDEAFGRVGVHSERGEESIDTIVMLYAGHDRVHLDQIETIRTGLFPPKKEGAKKRLEEGGEGPGAEGRAAKPAPKAEGSGEGSARRPRRRRAAKKR